MGADEIYEEYQEYLSRLDEFIEIAKSCGIELDSDEATNELRIMGATLSDFYDFYQSYRSEIEEFM